MQTHAMPRTITPLCLLATCNASCFPKNADKRTLGAVYFGRWDGPAHSLRMLGKTRELVAVPPSVSLWGAHTRLLLARMRGARIAAVGSGNTEMTPPTKNPGR